MNKLFRFFVGLAVFAVAMPVSAAVYTVSNKSDFETYFFKERANGECDTIYVKTGGKLVALSNGSDLPLRGTIHVIGVDDEETGKRSGLGWQWDISPNNEDDQLSIFLENLYIETNGGRTANSKYLFNIKDSMYHYIDSLAFINCEITNYNRALFRIQPEARANGVKDAGSINYFGVIGCNIHDGYLQTNPMSLFRMDVRVYEMVIKENTFYNLGNVHSLVQFATMTEDVGRADMEFTFENNTFIGSCTQGSLMIFDNFVGQSSFFHINNNIIMNPDWSDAYNNPGLDSLYQANPDSILNLKKSYIARTQFGFMECKNNVIYRFKNPTALLDVDGEGAWLSADTVYLNMADVEFGWDKFVDRFSSIYNIWNGEKIYTSGTDGTYIGAQSLYTDEKQVLCQVTVSMTGSNSADITVNSTTGTSYENKFLAGEKITVTANPKGKLNKFLGWSNGCTDLTQDIVLTEDLNLVASFEEQPYIAAWNLDQILTNNVKLNAPLAANYAKTPDTYFLRYRTWDGTQYVDSTTNAIMTRNNKVSGDLKNCFFIHTDSASFADKIPSDFVYFEIPSVEAGSKVVFNIATDNMCYKTTTVDYSTDLETWTNITRFDISLNGKWFPVKAELPAELAGQKVYVRIKGDESSDWFISDDMAAMIASGSNHRTTEFLFVSELYYVSGGFVGISSVKETEVDHVIYDIYGRRIQNVDNLQPNNIYIQGGRKFMVK